MSIWSKKRKNNQDFRAFIFFFCNCVKNGKKKHKKQNFNVKTFFAIIISFRGIVSLACVQSPFPTSFLEYLLFLS